MELQRVLHQLKIDFILSISPHSGNFATAIAMLIFALAFVVVGFVRLVEWQGLGFSKSKRRIFGALQILGSISAGLGFAIFAIDPQGQYKSLLTVLIGAGFLLLFPIHIYLALVRRVQSSKS